MDGTLVHRQGEWWSRRRRRHDTFTTLGGTSETGTLSYDGPVANSLPNLGATLIFDPVTCKYVFVANFAVKAKYGGSDAGKSNATVTGSATSERHHVPANLHVVGGDGPGRRAAGLKGPGRHR